MGYKRGHRAAKKAGWQAKKKHMLKFRSFKGRRVRFPPQDKKVMEKGWSIFRQWRAQNPVHGPITHREHLRRLGWKWCPVRKIMLPPSISARTFYGQ